MSLINEALNKSRGDKGVGTENVSLGVDTDAAQSTKTESKKVVKKRKTPVISFSILGTILAISIAFYYVCNYTKLIPQFSSEQEVRVSVKEDIDFAELAKARKEAALVQPEGAQNVEKEQTQPVEELEGANKEVAVTPPQDQGSDLITPAPATIANLTQPATAKPATSSVSKVVQPAQPVPSPVSNEKQPANSATSSVTQPAREVEKQSHTQDIRQPGWASPSLPVEVQSVEYFEEKSQVPEDDTKQEALSMPEQQQDDGEGDDDSWYASYLFGLGVFHQKNSEIEKAVEEYNKVIELDPDNAEVHINLGVIYKEKGALDKAVEEYGKALAIDPWLEVGYNNLGVVYFLKGNYSEAIKHYQKTLEINPENIESYVNLGIAYGRQKRSGEAEKALQNAISINPRHAETQYNLAVIYDENDKVEKALRHYSNFLEFYDDTNSELVEKVKRRIDVLSGKLKAKNMDAQ